MKTICDIEIPETISEMLADSQFSSEYYSYSAEKDSDFINEPERAKRCHDAASDGCDGKYHSEAIEDFREYGGILFDALEKKVDSVVSDSDISDIEAEEIEEQFEYCKSAYFADCDRLEEWHEKNGSLYEIIG